MYVPGVGLVPPAECRAGVVALVGGLHSLRDHQRAVGEHLLPPVGGELVAVLNERIKCGKL